MDKIKIEWIECTDAPSQVAVKLEDENDYDKSKSACHIESVPKNANASVRLSTETIRSSSNVMDTGIINKGNIRCHQCKSTIPEGDRLHIFKVWNRTRVKKIMVAVREPDVLAKVIAKASEKLQMIGTQLVLHTDGTMIDEDEIILMLKTETLILLAKNERWIPENYSYNINSPVSVTSTKTITSIDESTSQIYEVEDTFVNEVEDRSSPTNITPPTNITSPANITFPTNITSPSNITFPTNVTSPSNMTSPSNITSQSINLTPVVPISCSNFSADCLCMHWTIPWHKIPQQLLTSCQQGLNDKVTMTAMCHFIVDEMMSVNNFIPSKMLRRVSQNIVEKFPKAFQDIDEHGIVIGDGCSVLFTKLRERVSYLRRPHKRQFLKNTGRKFSFSGNFSEGVGDFGDLDDVTKMSSIVYEEVTPTEVSYVTEEHLQQHFETSEPSTSDVNDPIKLTSSFSNSNSTISSFLMDDSLNTDFPWSNWNIPWHKMPSSLLQSCEEGSRDKVTITKVCHFLVDEMRSVNSYVPAKAIRAVARKLVERYPTSFLDEDFAGCVLDDGFKSIFSKLLERASYLRRPGKRKPLPEEITKNQLGVSTWVAGKSAKRKNSVEVKKEND